jgi:Zn-dependent M28 family amino/carboxypeptidase
MKVPFVGASDGASSAAFLIEMAQALAHRKNRFTYWIVLFDGEEALDSWSASDGLYGSRHFVQALTAEQVKQIRAMINVDMIGDRNLHIHRDTHSDPQLSNLIFREGQELGYGRFFLETPHPVEDDHLPFVRAGIPAVDLISLGYGPLNLYWHTPLGTVGKCSATSLGIVGRVLLGALDDLETGRMAQIASR